MSGIVGSITKMSYEYNDLSINDKIKGIKTASYLKEKIEEAEIARKENKSKEEEKIDTQNLAKEIREDMER